MRHPFAVIKLLITQQLLRRFLQTLEYGTVFNVLSFDYFPEFYTSGKGIEKGTLTYTALRLGQLNDTKYATSSCRNKTSQLGIPSDFFKILNIV